MALPKLTTVKFSTTLPSNGNKIEFRPFLVKEEKALLIAMESEDINQMMMSLRDIVNSCVETDGFDVSKIPFFDAEYLFLQMRAKSIGEVSTLQYRHTDGINYAGMACDTVTDLKINLEEIKAEAVEGHNDTIELNDRLKVKLKYPNIMELGNINALDENRKELHIIASSIDYAFDDNEIYEADTFDQKIEFVESMTSQHIQKIGNFFDTMPRVRHKVSYKCAGCGQEDTITMEGLSDFF